MADRDDDSSSSSSRSSFFGEEYGVSKEFLLAIDLMCKSNFKCTVHRRDDLLAIEHHVHNSMFTQMFTIKCTRKRLRLHRTNNPRDVRTCTLVAKPRK